MPFNPYKCAIKRKYDIANHLCGFETPYLVEATDEKWQRVLENGETKHRQLAALLRDSWEGDPRLSPANAADRSAYRRVLIGEALKLHRKFKSSLALHLVPAKWQRDVGSLHDFDVRRELNNLQQHLRRKLKNHGTVILCVDFTVNIDSRRPDRSVFQPHLHGVAYGVKKADLDFFRSRYKPDRDHGVETPVKIIDTNDPLRQISYILKMDFKRWKPTRDRVHPREPMPKLRAHEQRELLLYLDQYKFGDLELKHGVRWRGTKLKPTRNVADEISTKSSRPEFSASSSA